MDLEYRRLSVLLLIVLLFINQSCNAEVDKKVCLGTNYYDFRLGTTEEHYIQLKEMYNGCEIVLGNLEITHLQPHHDTSFLKEIQEVNGYLLIVGNLVKTIPLVNLRIIRGISLYNNSALYISSNFDENNVANGLEDLPMRQLKEILHGGVTIAKSHRLCNMDIIEWKDIVHIGNDIVINQSPLPHCPTCDVNCNGSCWGPGPENCQILTKLICAQECAGRCRGPDPSDCCHHQCAAGCTGPKESDCLACLSVRDGNTCLESCPWNDEYNIKLNSLEMNPKKYRFGLSCVKKCPHNYIESDSGSCIQSCDLDTYAVRNSVSHYVMQEDKDKKSDWTESGQTSINEVLKHNTYIITTGKEIYNITSKLDKPKVDGISDKKVTGKIYKYCIEANESECGRIVASYPFRMEICSWFYYCLRNLCTGVICHQLVCSGTAQGLTQLGPVEYHYNFLKKMYQGCTIVLGNLEITSLQDNFDLSFLKDIQEVRGYVVIALNTAKSIPLGNLRIIRGETLFKNTALSIFSNYAVNVTHGLEELPMRQLQEIIHGGVLINRNPKLCNLHTIQWEDIVHSNYNISVEKSSSANCSECDKACSGSCWSLGPDNCQIYLLRMQTVGDISLVGMFHPVLHSGCDFTSSHVKAQHISWTCITTIYSVTKLVCDQTCPGRCRGPKPSDCCDHKCAAGCKGPKETDCLACKLVRDDHDKCLEFCSPLHTRNDVYPMENNKKDSCVIKCPVNYMVTDCGTCVEKCDPGSYMVQEYGVLRCKKCDGPCPKGKICTGIGYGNLKNTMAVNASNIDDFEHCTTVLGNIVILIFSIIGDPHTNTSAMDPAKLNILRSIREITGYLLIQWWPEDYTDLSIFENLEVIRGGPKYHWKYALAVTHVSISSLGLNSLKEVSDGDVIIQSKNLCYADTINWTRILRTNRQRIKTVHKNLEECVAEGKICDASCSEDGCWGPGPSQCFSHHRK